MFNSSDILCSDSWTLNVDYQDTRTAHSLVYFRSPNYPDSATPVDTEATCHITATRLPFRVNVFNSTSFLDDGTSDDYKLEVVGIPWYAGSSITRQLMVTGSTGGKPQRLNYPEFVGIDMRRITMTYTQGQRNLRFLLRFQGRAQTCHTIETIQTTCTLFVKSDLCQHRARDELLMAVLTAGDYPASVCCRGTNATDQSRTPCQLPTTTVTGVPHETKN